MAFDWCDCNDKNCTLSHCRTKRNGDVVTFQGKPKPASHDFWKDHGDTLRAGRITQAAAIIVSSGWALGRAVDEAFQIEKLVQQRIQQEKA